MGDDMFGIGCVRSVGMNKFNKKHPFFAFQQINGRPARAIIVSVNNNVSPWAHVRSLRGGSLCVCVCVCVCM